MNKITQDDINAFNEEPSLNRYQQAATKSAVYPGQGTFLGLLYVNGKLNGEAGEFSEHLNKALRDDGIASVHEILSGDSLVTVQFPRVYLSEDREAKLIKELGDILWYVSAAAKEMGYSLSHIARTNLYKLKDRTDRQTLHGDGDTR